MPTAESDGGAALTDSALLLIFSHLDPHSLTSAGLVSKKWLALSDRLRQTLTLLDWPFLAGPARRLVARFPDLTDVDLVPAALQSTSSPVILSSGRLSVRLDPESEEFSVSRFPVAVSVDEGLEILSRGCPGLRKLATVATASGPGMLAAAANCPTLMELDLFWCSDAALGPISAFGNLQVLKIVGSGLTDIGLTILAHGCKRLVKLDISNCEGSYDGVSAVGRCCPMLEELTLVDHRMDPGWLAGLPFCGNLKTLRVIGCRSIDRDPGAVEHLGVCPAVEQLHLERCQLRDKRSLNALFYVCGAARDLFFRDCWGLDDDVFALAGLCRGVKSLSLEGCSVLTTEGLEAVILSWTELQNLSVVACKKVGEGGVTPALAGLFSQLKELKWRPDSRSVLMESLAGTGMGKKGGRRFKWA